MLTKEEITKCLEFTEDWHFTPGEKPTWDLYYICPVNEGSVYAIYLNEDMSVRGGYYHYKSFLQDVIEGINKAYHENKIEECVEILYDKVLFSTNMCSITDIGVVAAKEQAIKHVLMEIEEIKC